MPSGIAYSAADNELAQQALQWLVDNYTHTKSMAKNLCKKIDCKEMRPQIMEALLAECVDRIPRIFELYNPDIAPLEHYARTSLRWYMFKKRNEILNSPEHEAYDKNTPIVNDNNNHDRIEVLELVTKLVHRLPTHIVDLLTDYVINGKRFEDIAEQFGVCRATAYNDYYAALAYARAELSALLGESTGNE